ncbi:hypothetical protein GCM10027162_31010 [Streptomyces incanus]
MRPDGASGAAASRVSRRRRRTTPRPRPDGAGHDRCRRTPEEGGRTAGFADVDGAGRPDRRMQRLASSAFHGGRQAPGLPPPRSAGRGTVRFPWTPGLCERAVRMVAESSPNRPTEWFAMKAVTVKPVIPGAIESPVDVQVSAGEATDAEVGPSADRYGRHGAVGR